MRSLGTVLRSVDAAQLALALKGADEAMTDLCLSTMSQRAGETIRDEMDEMTMVKRSDVEDAQKAIMQVVRQMAAKGDIVIAGDRKRVVKGKSVSVRVDIGVGGIVKTKKKNKKNNRI